MKKSFNKFVHAVLIFSMVVWSVAPGIGVWINTAQAEEITPTEIPVVEPVVTPVVDPVVEEVSTPTEDIATPAIEEKISPAEDSQPVLSAWTNDGNKYTTTNTVELGTTYTSPQNDQVTVTFTKLPENPGKLSIEEITLTAEQVASLGALSDKAYDITSDMAVGTFAFDLNLPKPVNQENVQIKFAETEAGLENADTVATSDITTETDSVSASLNHFTIFVVAGATSTIPVSNLQPSWDVVSGSGGVWSSYQGPSDNYKYNSPGATIVHDGREAAPIYAGVTV